MQVMATHRFRDILPALSEDYTVSSPNILFAEKLQRMEHVDPYISPPSPLHS